VSGGGREIAIADVTHLRDLADARAPKAAPSFRPNRRKPARSSRRVSQPVEEYP